jgi:tetratricopeptide (TPR) repeat protein
MDGMFATSPVPIIAVTAVLCTLAACATLSENTTADGAPGVKAPFDAPFTYDRWPPPAAAEALEKAKEKAAGDPEDARDALTLCDAHGSRGAWFEAAAACAAAADLAPTVVGIQQRLVSIYWNLRAYDKARDAAAAAAALLPDDAATRYWLGVGHAKLGEDVDAARELDRALSLAPDRTDFYPEAVEVHRRLNDLGRAAELAATAARLAPGDDELARLPADVEKTINERLLSFNAVVLEEPENPAAYAYLGGGMVRYGMYTQAVAEFDNALARMPAVGAGSEALEQLRAEVHYNRANALRLAGRRTEAVTGFTTARELRPALIPQADFMIGLCHLDDGRAQEAIPFLEASVAAAPGVPDNRAALVRAYDAVGRGEDAAAAREELEALK